MNGYDYELIQKVSSAVSIPVVACGGAGKLSDCVKAVNAGASAAAAGSLFVYYGPLRAVLINYPTQTELAAIFYNEDKNKLMS
jgi:cyclase